MLQALYIIAFAVLSVLAISNLVRNLILLGSDTRREPRKPYMGGNSSENRSDRSIPHPEMLDERGRVVDEPLLVMKSISLEDAREQLDALFDNSSGLSDSNQDEEA